MAITGLTFTRLPKKFPSRTSIMILSTTACFLALSIGAGSKEVTGKNGDLPSGSLERSPADGAVVIDEAEVVSTLQPGQSHEDHDDVDDDVEDFDDDDESDLWLFQYDPIEVGHVQDVEVEDGVMLQMKTLAINPPIFEIKNFLTDAECDHLIELASRRGLYKSETIPEEVPDGDYREATVTYFRELDANEDEVLNPEELLEAVSSFSAAQGVEISIDHVKELAAQKLDTNDDGVVDLDEFIASDTPAMEEEINKWLAEIGGLDEREAQRSQARVSEQTWLDQWTTDDDVLIRLQDRVIGLTWLPGSIIQTSEQLQVVRYEPGGHYHAHYDSADVDDNLECAHTFGIESDDDFPASRFNNDFNHKRLCRFATVLFYLNDVEEGGETAFPVADNETFTLESLDASTYDIYDLSNHCHKSNVVVPPEKGKAILWYNHYLDEENGWMGDNRNHSLHGGCDVISGTKWIANNWITVDNDVHRQILFHDRYYSPEEGYSEGSLSTAEETETDIDGAELEDEGYSSDLDSRDSITDSRVSDSGADRNADIVDHKSAGTQTQNVDNPPSKKEEDKTNESARKSDMFDQPGRAQSGRLDLHTIDEL
ncbi:transmembrane prolyl 4-hydroxylase-like [Diadema antillarum]|uniref:transmembrane prolyl 4-hydroxylase-like n=1 Tax=Diadema antillarum TaxID=105358 RepID=UPI003A892992